MVKKRGSALAYKIFIYNYKIWGYTIMSISLHFVVLFYVLSSKDLYAVLKGFYGRVQKPFNFFVFYRHIHSYATSLFDRFASLIKPESFTFIDNVGEEHLFQEGGVMVLSHFGGWGTIVNAFGRREVPTINIVMDEVLDEGTSQFEGSLNKNKQTASLNKIDLSKNAFAAQITIANALLNNEIVAMMADRVVQKDKSVSLPFFNENADFATTPYELAFKLKKKVFAIFIIRTGKREYTLYSEELCYDAASNAQDASRHMASGYAKHLESYAKNHPEQWYNFYNFWRPTC